MKRTYIIIADNFPPSKGGGIAEWAYGTAVTLSEMGHNVTVLSHWKNKQDASVHMNQPFRVFPMYGRDWNRYRYWYALYYLRNFLHKHPEAIILAATWSLAYPMTLLGRLYPKSRYVVIAHGLEVTKVEKINKIKPFNKTISGALLTIAVSRFTRNEIIKLTEIASDNIIFLPNGVETRRFCYDATHPELRRKLGIPEKARIILTLARVIDRKGHDTVLKALPEILTKFPETIYIIAGPWEKKCYDRLRALSQDLGIASHVCFTSFVQDSDLNRFYSMSDIYIMVSRTLQDAGDSEGFGITFLEANACGCPVIGSYAGGIPDAVEDGINGFLVEPDDHKAVADTIVRLFEDDRLRETLSAQGKKRVSQQFTWRIVTEKLTRSIENRLATQTRR